MIPTTAPTVTPIAVARFVKAQSDLPQAVEAWRTILGDDRVIVDKVSLDQHGKNTIGTSIRSVAIIRPSQASQVNQLVRVAAKYCTPLYPTSTGRNAGYGSAVPTAEGSTVLDLSDLRSIRMIDQDLGVVSIEPGVTQGQLHQWLHDHGLDFMVPVHGGGPSCSLLGNALERGYGLTPTTDHFEALTSVRAVLADGSNYQSAFHAMGAELIGSCHRWGIGPYVEGLFSQGNFAIVTEGTISLVRRHEHVEAFFIRLRNAEELGVLTDTLRDLLGSMGGTVSGVNLMNDRRVLSMSRPYPVEQVGKHEIISDDLCKTMSKSAGVQPWTAAGVIHCPTRMRKAIRRELRRQLPAMIGRPIHFNRRRIAAANRAARVLPVGGQSILKQLSSIDALLDLADGIPRRVALPLAYWLRGESPSESEDMNPSQDGCGLIWYSPLVPMKSNVVREYTDMVNRVCRDHQIEPLITLTTLSPRLFDSTVPILFRPEQQGAMDRAKRCYEDLFTEGKRIGCLPYRLSTESMSKIDDATSPGHFDHLSKLKTSFDPQNLIAPGRYTTKEKNRC